jgi:hypothetical protein
MFGIKGDTKPTYGEIDCPSVRSTCDRETPATLVSYGMGDQKCNYPELLRDSEGTLSRWSQLHLQSLAPTNSHWAGVVSYGPFSLCVIHKVGLCLSSEDINMLMMNITRLTIQKITLVWHHPKALNTSRINL